MSAETILEKAKLAEQAERYKDMARVCIATCIINCTYVFIIYLPWMSCMSTVRYRYDLPTV